MSAGSCAGLALDIAVPRWIPMAQLIALKLDPSLDTNLIFQPDTFTKSLGRAEGTRLFDEIHAPAVREILKINRADRRLLDFFGLGDSFFFVRDQAVFLQKGHERFDQFFLDFFGIDHGERRSYYRYGELAEILHRPWIEQAQREVSLSTASAIGWGEKRLA